MKTLLYSLLRWSERYTKTDMLYLARGGFWTMSGQGVTFIASFALVWAFAHFLSPETYGTYKFVLSVFAILSVSTLPGVRVALARAAARGMTGSIKALTHMQMRWGLLGLLGSVALAAYYFYNDNIELGVLFLIAAPFVPFLETFVNYESYLLGLKDFKTKAIFQLVQRTMISVVVIVVIILSDNVYIVTAGYLTAFSLVAFWLNKSAIKKHPTNNLVDDSAQSYSFHLTGMNVLSTVAQQLDKMLLFHYVGPAMLAAYFFASALPQELRSLFGQVNTIAFPKFSVANPAVTAKALFYKITLYILILIIPTVLYISIAPFLFSFFFPQYMNAVVYSQALAPLLLFTPFFLVHHLLTAFGKTKKLYAITIMGPAVLILSLLVLLPVLGVWGVIIALYVKEVTLSVAYLVFLVLELGLGRKHNLC